MIYAGIHPTSEASHYPQIQYSHSETVHGKLVDYYHCWRNDYDAVKPVLPDDRLADTRKLRGLEGFLRDNATEDDE